MEYDEQVSARLHMSLDEIIGQDQHDESTQVKKRRPRRVPAGASSPPLATTSASSSRPSSLPTTESAGRYPAPVPPFLGYPSRPPPNGRPLPALMRAPHGRLAAPPPFGMGPRPPFPLPFGHARVDPSWPRMRQAGPAFVMPFNGAHPPPPPGGAGPDMRPSRLLPVPPRPGPVDIIYPPRRPLLGPYGAPRAAQPGVSRAGWKRSRFPDEGREEELEDSQSHHHHPMGHHMAFGTGVRMPPHVVGDMNGSLPNQMHRLHDAPRHQHAVCENRSSADYYDSPYARDLGHGYGTLCGDEISHPSNHALPFKVEDRNRYEAADQSAGGRNLPLPTGPFPVREALGSCARAPSAESREFTVIVSNVPKDLPAVEIQEAFSCMGTVLRTDIMLNSKGEHTGRVCIAFASAEAAKTAVECLSVVAAQFDEGDLNGNTIRVFAE